MASTGTAQSTSNSIVPRSADSVRVQFWNGFWVKYDVGKTSRRSSQRCTTT
jgi:hypothetical protein